MKKLLAIFIILNVFNQLQGQDRQFSQFSASPLNLNPALTGNNSCDWRVGANIRNEWLGVNGSFFYSSIYGDLAIGKIKNKKMNFAGIGLIANFDNAGQLNYKTTDAYLSAAYHMMLGRRANSTLSIGLQGGIRYYTFDLGKVILDENIDFITGTITQSSSLITNSNAVIPDANLGAMYNFKKNDRFGYYLGMSAFHIPQGSYTYTNGASTENLKFKFSAQGGTNIAVGYHVTVMPQVIWMWQNKLTQWRVGSYVKYSLTDPRRTNKINKSAYIGAWFWKAYKASKLSFAARYDVGNLNMAISYDIDVSNLSSISAAGGAPEFSISYSGCFPRNNSKFACPVVL